MPASNLPKNRAIPGCFIFERMSTSLFRESTWRGVWILLRGYVLQAISTPVLECTALRTTANAPLPRMVEDNTSSPKCLRTGKLLVGLAKTGTTLRTDEILDFRLLTGDLLAVDLSENPSF